MDTVNDYWNAAPEKRAHLIAKRTPPLAQTHRGKPAPWTMRGYLDAVKPDRTPTHRAPGAPITPAWAQTLLAANGKGPA